MTPAARAWSPLPVALLAAAALLAPARAAPDEATIRFGVHREEFRDVNDNDATVALSAYAKAVGDEYGVRVRIVMLDGPHGARDALKHGDVDLIDLPASQLLDVDPEDVEGPLLVSSVDGGLTDRYVVLVRAESPIKTVGDLRGRSLVQSDDQRSAIATAWLTVLLRQHGMGAPARALGRIDLARKPAQAVLPAFFGKYDACLVSRAAWELMGELNPQVRTQLRPVAESPPLVAGMAIFRKGIPAAMKQRVLEVLGPSQKSAAFQQVLMLFRIKTVTLQPASILDGTRELLTAYQRIALEEQAAQGPRKRAVATRPSQR
jgi:ABC-type phosphate/phosphonate transport system substrate-binding protein